ADAWCSSTSSRASRASRAGSTAWRTRATRMGRSPADRARRVGRRSAVRETCVRSKPDKQGQAVVRRVWRRRSDEGQGSAWKVAFADFCLALLCLFLVLWLLAAREQERLAALLESRAMLHEGLGRMLDEGGGPGGSMISRDPQVGGGSKAEGVLLRGEVLQPPRARLETPAEMMELAQILTTLGEEAGLSGNLQSVITPYGL